MSEKKVRTMADAMRDMNKMYGDSTQMWKGDDEILVREDGIPTGSFVLDEAISKMIWGIPRGRILQFAGHPSSGKTLLSLSCIKEMQTKNPNSWALFVDAEMTFDQDWASKIGVDIGRVSVISDNNGAAIFNALLGVPPKKKTEASSKKPGLLDLEIAEPSGLELIVLDSVASIVPPVEELTDVGSQKIAPLSRFLPEVLRKLTPLLGRTGVSFVGINQIRVKPDVMWGNPETSPGGNAFHHHQSLCLNLAQMSNKHNIVENNEIVGHRIRVKITKSKVAPGKDKEVEFDIKYEKGIVNQHIDAIDLGIKYNLIERPNNRKYIIKGDADDSLEIDGRENLNKYFDENKEAAYNMIQKIMQMTKE